jgi:hypothetical protein
LYNDSEREVKPMLDLFRTEVYSRDIVYYEGEYYVVDTVKTLDAGWETGVSRIDKEAAFKYWLDEAYDLEAMSPTDELDAIEEVGEQFTTGWAVINYPNKKAAIRGHKKAMASPTISENWD